VTCNEVGEFRASSILQGLGHGFHFLSTVTPPLPVSVLLTSDLSHEVWGTTVDQAEELVWRQEVVRKLVWIAEVSDVVRQENVRAAECRRIVNVLITHVEEVWSFAAAPVFKNFVKRITKLLFTLPTHFATRGWMLLPPHSVSFVEYIWCGCQAEHAGFIALQK